LLAKRGATVVVQVYPDLVPLPAAMPAIAAVAGSDNPRPEADVVTSVISLPLAFGIHSANVPYLLVPPDRHASWLDRAAGRVSVLPSRDRRTATIGRRFRRQPRNRLLALSGSEIHFLHKDVISDDQAWLDAIKPAIAIHTHHVNDFADTAALIAEMDAIVPLIQRSSIWQARWPSPFT
jgi:hypothetical protein